MAQLVTSIIDFSTISPESVITEQGIERLRFSEIFFDGREMYKGTPVGKTLKNISVGY